MKGSDDGSKVNTEDGWEGERVGGREERRAHEWKGYHFHAAILWASWMLMTI